LVKLVAAKNSNSTIGSFLIDNSLLNKTRHSIKIGVKWKKPVAQTNVTNHHHYCLYLYLENKKLMDKVTFHDASNAKLNDKLITNFVGKLFCRNHGGFCLLYTFK
jgi:hypothetical protein